MGFLSPQFTQFWEDFINMLTKLLGAAKRFLGEESGAQSKEWYKKIVQPILDVANELLVPLLIVLGTAGTIYAIVLGVNFAKAETTDKREEAKKRMINFIIGFVVTIVLLILLKLFVKAVKDGSISQAIDDVVSE